MAVIGSLWCGSVCVVRIVRLFGGLRFGGRGRVCCKASGFDALQACRFLAFPGFDISPARVGAATDGFRSIRVKIRRSWRDVKGKFFVLGQNRLPNRLRSRRAASTGSSRYSSLCSLIQSMHWKPMLR